MWLLAGASRLLPLAQDGVDLLPYLLARELPIAGLTQEAIVAGVDVAHMRHHGQPHRLRFRAFAVEVQQAAVLQLGLAFTAARVAPHVENQELAGSAGRLR